MAAQKNPVANPPELGHPLADFPLRHQFTARWGRLVIGGLIILLSALLILLTAQDAWWRYYFHGPAAIGWQLVVPFVAGGLAGILGLALITRSLREWHRYFALYENGFQAGRGRYARYYRYAEVASLREKYSAPSLLGISGRPHYTGTLCLAGGERLQLDNTISNVDRLITELRDRAMPAMAERLQIVYHLGQPLGFGPLTIQKDCGIRYGEANLTWDELNQVKIDQGALQMIGGTNKSEGNRFSIKTEQIPNLEILYAILMREMIARRS